MSDIRRILDANANRSREAMRVMEEAARFLLDDAALSGELKAMRHDLAEAMRARPSVELFRDTPGDVGTAITGGGETRRGSAAEVVAAAGKRLSEALRCCEEYGKLSPAPPGSVSAAGGEGDLSGSGPGGMARSAGIPDGPAPRGTGSSGAADGFAAAMERLRYRGYDVEARLRRRLAGPTARQWRLCVIVTQKLCRRPWLEVARAAAEAGADCLQLREKNLSDGELLERARRLVAAVRELEPGGNGVGPAILVNDRPDVALSAGAGGVHLGRGDLPVRAVRKLAGERLLIGASTHDPAEARAAVEAGADYCGVGAMFATATKRREPSGPAYLRRFLADYPRVPHLAIGGVAAENVGELVEAGARGVAVSRAVCAADDPAAATAKILERMAGAGGGSAGNEPRV